MRGKRGVPKTSQNPIGLVEFYNSLNTNERIVYRDYTNNDAYHLDYRALDESYFADYDATVAYIEQLQATGPAITVIYNEQMQHAGDLLKYCLVYTKHGVWVVKCLTNIQWLPPELLSL